MSDVDRHVAANVRRLRVDRGMTQQNLAKALGISFQQLQKYETGKNRITIGRLVAICEQLEVSLSQMVHGISKTAR